MQDHKNTPVDQKADQAASSDKKPLTKWDKAETVMEIVDAVVTTIVDVITD